MFALGTAGSTPDTEGGAGVDFVTGTGDTVVGTLVSRWLGLRLLLLWLRD